MRSGRDGLQESLFALPVEPEPRSRTPRTPRSRATRRAPSSAAPVHRVSGDALAQDGLPDGTEVTLGPAGRPRRGDLVVVRLRDRTEVGILGHELGRPTLRTGTGSVWLDPACTVLGVAQMIAAPLEGVAGSVQSNRPSSRGRQQ